MAFDLFREVNHYLKAEVNKPITVHDTGCSEVHHGEGGEGSGNEGLGTVLLGGGGGGSGGGGSALVGGDVITAWLFHGISSRYGRDLDSLGGSKTP